MKKLHTGMDNNPKVPLKNEDCGCKKKNTHFQKTSQASNQIFLARGPDHARWAHIPKLAKMEHHK